MQTNCQTTIVDFANFKLFDTNNKYKVFQRDQIQYEIDNSTNNKIKTLNIISTDSNKFVVSGILEINSKIIYGYDNKKRPYKLFTPFANKLFPKFLIAYSGDKIAHNKIVSVKLKSWTDVYPIGEIVASFGDLDPLLSILEIASNYRHSLLNYSGFNFIKRIKQNYDNEKLEIIFNHEINKQQSEQHFHTVRTTDERTTDEINNFLLICNIDPPGCTDIDDVISYSELNNDVKIIGVHISDVMYLLYLFAKNYDCNFVNNIHTNMFTNEIFATVYPSSNEKPFGIISDYLIDKFLTLKTNVKRYVWSTYYYIDIKTNKIINVETKPEIIINKNTYTYNEAETLLKLETNKYMNFIANFASSYGQEHYPSVYNSYENHNYNSHYMISLLMTLTNHHIGKQLHNDTKTIYRSTQMIDGINLGIYNFNKTTTLTPTLTPILTPTPTPNYHAAININNYTHFTSPIRRFIDQYVHFRMYKLYFSSFDSTNNIFKLINTINESNLKTVNQSLFSVKTISNQFKLLSLIKSQTENIYTCKLIDLKYDNDENKLHLKWLVKDEDIKIYDTINNPLVTINYVSDSVNTKSVNTKSVNTKSVNAELANVNSITLHNRLYNSDSDSIVLINGSEYVLKINLVLLNNMKNIKIVVSYFN